MTRKNWEKIADEEFESLDKEWQDEWSDLRNLVVRRRG